MNIVTDKIKESLKEYKTVNEKQIYSIKPGDNLRYFINGNFRMGGVVKINKYPKYIVLINPINKATWCVQLTAPTLKLYIKPLTKIKKEKREMKKIYEMWKNGKLCEASSMKLK